MKRITKRNFKIIVLTLLMLCLGLALPAKFVFAAADQWSTSLHDISRDGASTDTGISTSNASQLTKLWSLKTGAPLAAQPAILNGVAYIGSWDGYEYAINVSTGNVLWKTNLGITNGFAYCNPPTAGISSAPTVQNGVLYVGGGDSYWYALNADTGAVEWKVFTGDNSAAAGHYNWSSPLIYGNYAYIGVASFGDCPLVQGQLLKVDLSTHQIVGTLNLVPDGQVGAGIWTSPAYDPATDTIYAVTGTEQADAQTFAQAIIAINASTMTVTSYWHIPEKDVVADSDWTTSTLLYTDGNNRQLVLATNKNGITYAFLRSNLAAGPVWQQRIAIGNDCAACGFSTVSSAALGQGRIYQAGGVTTVNGKGYAGSVQAWDSTTGSVLWQHPVAGPVIGAITYDNGMVVDGAGSAIEVLDASNGHRLYSYDTGGGSWIFEAPSVAAGTIITGNTNGTIYALGLPATLPPDPPADANCPSSWLCQDVGSPAPAGSENVSNGVWNVSAGGVGVGGIADSFRLMTQSAAGDTQINAKVVSQQSISANSQAGIMLRQSNDPGSPYYAVFATPNGVKVMYRNTFNGNTTTVNSSNPGVMPVYLEIQRVSDKLQAATSADGTTYTLVPGATATVVEPYQSLAGLAVSSDMSGTASMAVISNVSIGAPNNNPQNTPPTSTCPSGWNCSDVGDPQLVGDQTVSGNIWTIKGSGKGVDASVDQFHYVWQSATGDATLTTHLTGQTNPDNAAKSGLMVRADTSAESAYYGAFVTPAGNIVVQTRTIRGLPIFDTLATIDGTPPQYLQIIRSGTTFTTYTSTDGNNWSPVVGSTSDVGSLNGTVLEGLAVTSGTAAATSTATADLLSVTNATVTPPTICPGSWTCSEVGLTIPVGSQYYHNGVWSVLAGGKDIWDMNDEMRLVSQYLNGDGSVSVHVVSQGDSDAWAKSGIMLRASNDESAPYFGIFVTPGNGTVVQYRNANGDGTSQVSGVTSTAPTYLKINRAGNTFTAYTSVDGVTWTAFPGGSVTIAAIPTSALAGMASSSHSQFKTNTSTFDGFTLTPNNSSLPSPWVDNDIDNSTPAGSAGYAGNTFTIKGGGNDIWKTPYGTLDQSHFVSQSLTSDGSIVARVTSQTNTSAWAKSGIMLKQSAAADAPYVLLAVTPTNGIVFQHDYTSSTSGGAYTFPNVWLKLTRTGNVVTAYISTDGNTWAQVGTASEAFTTPLRAGLFVNSHSSGDLNTSTFDNVSFTGGATTSGLPAPWNDTDVGNPSTAGSASYANGTFTVNGAGNDIWGTAAGNLDEFHYVDQPLSGNGTITARVTSQTNTSDWAKAGVMVKQSTTAGTNYALMAVTPANGSHFEYGFSNDTSGGAYTFPTAWIRLNRIGNTITAYTSADGNSWTQVGTTTVALNDPVTVGLFVCSHSSGTLSTATFDNVSVTGGSVTSNLPSPWVESDVGNPATAGSASYANGTFTVNGAGNDIWGTAAGNLDEFHYVDQPLSGNGTITARVTSQTNTSDWAKAGVMVKQSTTAGTNYALFGITPTNGLHFQYGFSQDISGGAFTFPNAWVRLTRAGNVITAYKSADGITWTQVGTATVTLNDPITIGLFVCSHNSGTLSTVTFDNVSVTSP